MPGTGFRLFQEVKKALGGCRAVTGAFFPKAKGVKRLGQVVPQGFIRTRPGTEFIQLLEPVNRAANGAIILGDRLAVNGEAADLPGADEQRDQDIHPGVGQSQVRGFQPFAGFRDARGRRVGLADIVPNPLLRLFEGFHAAGGQCDRDLPGNTGVEQTKRRKVLFKISLGSPIPVGHAAFPDGFEDAFAHLIAQVRAKGIGLPEIRMEVEDLG